MSIVYNYNEFKYLDKRGSKKIWPHDVIENEINLECDLVLRRNNGPIGQSRLIINDPGTNIEDISDLSTEWDEISISVKANLDTDNYSIGEVVKSNKESDALSFCSFTCKNSKFYKYLSQPFNDYGNNFEIKIPRDELWGTLKIEFYVLLKTDLSQDSSSEAYHKGSIVATARALETVLDSPKKIFGGGIKEFWGEDFSTSISNALFQLRWEEGEPCIYWNAKNNNQIKALLTDPSQEVSPRTLFRDLILHQVGVLVFIELLVAAEKDPARRIENDIDSKILESIRKVTKFNSIEKVIDEYEQIEQSNTSNLITRMQHNLNLSGLIKGFLNSVIEEQQ